MKKHMAKGRVPSAKKNSPIIQVELAMIQNTTAMEWSSSPNSWRHRHAMNKAIASVGPIMITPRSLRSITQQRSFSSQSKMWKFSLVRMELNMAGSFGAKVVTSSIPHVSSGGTNLAPCTVALCAFFFPL